MSVAFCAELVLSTTLLFAKGTTTKITISGEGLRNPIEISNPSVLETFTVWAGPGTFANGVEGREGFIINWASGVVNDLPTPLHMFRLSFYARGASHSNGDDQDRVAYVVSYGIDAMTGFGYVYLPGKGDESYALNTTTIDRGCEGKWFRATAVWQSTFQNIVRPSRGAAGP